MNPQAIMKAGKEELEALVHAPTGENLELFFNRRTRDYKYTQVPWNSGMTVGICHGLHAALKPRDAYHLLPAAAKILLKQTQPIKVEQALDMVSDVVYASRNPVNFQSHFEDLGIPADLLYPSRAMEIPIAFELLFDDIETKLVSTNIGIGGWNRLKKLFAIV